MKPTFQKLTGLRYVAAKPMQWEVGAKGSDHWIDLPAFTPFDSSVPWFMRWALSPHDPRFLLAAWVHDTMLAEGYDRAQAAKEWFHGALAGGAPVWKAKAAAVAVYWWALYKPGAY